jgi:hypothetical protein
MLNSKLQEDVLFGTQKRSSSLPEVLLPDLMRVPDDFQARQNSENGGNSCFKHRSVLQIQH